MIRNLICVLLAMLVVSAARGDVVFTSFDAGGGFSPQSNVFAASADPAPINATVRAGAQFLVGGSGFTLDSVTLPISQQNSSGLGNFLRVRLAAESGGAPGATIEVLSLNQPVPQFANPFVATTTFNSTSHPRLTAGVRYWIVTELSSPPVLGPSQRLDFRWFFSNTGPIGTYRQQQTFGGLTADPWPGATSSVGIAFRVNGTPLVLTACCNRRTGACGLVETTTCQALSMVALSASQTCTPNPCPAGCHSSL